MNRVKATVKNIMALSGLQKILGPGDPRHIYIFSYHRVRPPLVKHGQFHDGVAGIGAEEFSLQMAWLRQNFDVLSESQFLEQSKETSKITRARPAAMITFDDGYIDNFQVAMPILKGLGMPALFFIPTKIIEERTLGWWDIIAYILKKSAKRTFVFRGGEYTAGPNSQASIERLNSIYKRSGNDPIFFADLSRELGVPLPSQEMQSQELMTWQQIREARASGFAIGSHAHSHRSFRSLSIEEQRAELTTSRRILEEKLQHPIRTFAFPLGSYDEFTLESKRLVRECGYEAAFSYLTGIAAWDSLDAFDVQRAHPPSTLSDMRLACSLPRLFFRNESARAAPTPTNHD